MKRKMNNIIGLLKHGDLGIIADEAKMNPTTLTDVLQGRKNIESYSSLVPVLKSYVTRRKEELQGEVDLVKHTDEVYKELNLKPPTNEELLKKSLNWYMLDHMNESKLLEVNEELGLRISTKDSDDWGSGDWDDFIEKIGVKIGLKERED